MPILKVALLGTHEGISKDRAIKELMRLGENIGYEITARRFLGFPPKSVKVSSDNLEEFKKIFETQEFFHYQRIDLNTGREIWVTLEDPDADPDGFFKFALGLISDLPWGASIVLQEGAIITFDRSP